MSAIEYFPGPFDEVATKPNGGGKKDLIVQDMYICTPCNVTTNQYQMYIYFGKHHDHCPHLLLHCNAAIITALEYYKYWSEDPCFACAHL